MDDRDWLLRQLKQLLEFVRRLLTKISKLREEKQLDQALAELGAGYLELFGLEARFLPMMTPEAVRRSLGSSAREELLADLLRAEVEIRTARGEVELAGRLRALADALGTD